MERRWKRALWFVIRVWDMCSGDPWGKSRRMDTFTNVRTSTKMANVTVAVKMVEPEPRVA